MAPQPIDPRYSTPQQMGLSFEQYLPYIAMMNNRKGSMNADISTLFDPQFGIMSNSYTEPSQMSDQQIEDLYGRTTAAIRQSNDPNLQGILTDIQNGKSAFEIKQAIMNGVNSGSIQSSDGTGKEFTDLVDELFKESQTIDEKKFAQANQDDIYERAGLPNPNMGFDPYQMSPEVFGSVDESVNKSKPGTDAKLAAIKAKYDAMNQEKIVNPKSESKSIEFFIKDIGTKTGGKKVRSQQEANRMGVLAKRIRDTAAGKSVYAEVNPDGSGKYYTKADLPKLIAQLEQESGYNLDIGGSPTLKDTARVKGRDKYIQDANQQLEMERAGGAAKQLKSNLDPGHVAINPFDKAAMGERIKQMVAEKISAGLAQRGETPFNLAMLQRASLNKSSKG
jgi:hypothetical protein